MTSKLLPTLGALGALGIASACGIDSVSAPATTAWASSALVTAARDVDAGGDEEHTVVALTRRVPLDHDISATATVGPRGGVIAIEDAGVTVVFPRGALSASTQITMTAKAGAAVAYEFRPHGITFDAPVWVGQDLTSTQIAGGELAAVQAGYYEQPLDAIFVDPTKSLARVTQLRKADLDRAVHPRMATFYILHFSGYIMSSGFADGGWSDSTSTALKRAAAFPRSRSSEWRLHADRGSVAGSLRGSARVRRTWPRVRAQGSGRSNRMVRSRAGKVR